MEETKDCFFSLCVCVCFKQFTISSTNAQYILREYCQKNMQKLIKLL